MITHLLNVYNLFFNIACILNLHCLGLIVADDQCYNSMTLMK